MPRDIASFDTDESPASPPKKPQRSLGKSVLIFFRDVAIILAIAVVVSFLVKTFLIRSFYIPSGSMETTLHGDPNPNNADKVIVNELVPDIVPLAHGDIVVFRDPGGWLGAPTVVKTDGIQQGWEWFLSLFGLASPDSDQHLIKRVIGLPGDTVACCTPTGQLTVNGTPLVEPYATLDQPNANYDNNENGRSGTKPWSVTVPAGSFWAMGDNRGNSQDSRFHMDQPSGGFVSMDDVVGRAFVISWPISRWSWLSNYPDTFSMVPAPATTATTPSVPVTK